MIEHIESRECKRIYEIHTVFLTVEIELQREISHKYDEKSRCKYLSTAENERFPNDNF